MIGVDVSFANALRRILLSDIPTVAIEHVYMWNNSSIVHDEVLAHRIGLVPLQIDARLFDQFEGEDDEPTDRNTIVFRMGVECSNNDPENNANNSTNNASSDSSSSAAAKGDNTDNDDSVVQNNNPDLEEAVREAAAAQTKNNDNKFMELPDRPYTKHVYSSELEWVPQGDQETRFPDGIQPVHTDILLAKLRPGQGIGLEAHARVGTGRDHAKFSPVATASYRLMPHLELTKPVYDEVAEELVHLYEPGVFELVPATSAQGDPPSTKVKAKLCNAYACTMSRNFMRHAELKDSIRMSRIPNHYIFSVESVGQVSPAVLVAQALQILQRKCESVIQLASETVDGSLSL